MSQSHSAPQPINALLFDKDGTLFGFQQSWGKWCERVLAILAPDDLNMQRKLAVAAGYDLTTGGFAVGSSIVNAEASATNQLWAALLVDKTEAEIERVGLAALQDLPLAPVTPLAPLLAQLKSAGYKLGVATNDFEATAIAQLEQAGIIDQFDFICGFDSGHGSKPGAGMIQAFAIACDVPCEQIAMIGDSTHDLQAGTNAAVGLRIGVLTGPALHEDLQPLADHVLNSIAQLPTLLAVSVGQ